MKSSKVQLLEASYKNIGYLFILILICSFFGFYTSYFVHFPVFSGITIEQHFHAAMMVTWLMILIVQPFLIRFKKVTAHKIIGRSTYILAPALLLSIFWIARMAYFRNETRLTPEENLGELSMSIPDILGFSLLYVLAMLNRKKTPLHMRYIIGTSLLLISPGLGRIFLHFAHLTYDMAFMIPTVVALVLLLLLLVADIVKRRPYKPYLVTLMVFLGMNVCVAFQMSWWWQAFASKIVQFFF